MNPLTQIKNTQKASKYEIAQGFSESASWHARFKHSAYIFAGGLPFDLTEGDLLAIFSQYGELVDINLVKDKDTGKPRGFAFAAYEDQRSTVLAVDNLSGSRVAGRTIRVEHVDNYKRKKAEMEGREPSPDTAADDGEDGPAEDAAAAVQLPGPPQTAAAKAGASGQDAWMGSNSLFSLLQEDAPQPRAGSAAAAAAGGALVTAGSRKDKKAKKEHKEKKDKKDKKEKKEKREKQAKGSSRAQPDSLQSPAAQPAAEAAGGGRDHSGMAPHGSEAAGGSRGTEDREGRGSRYDDRRDRRADQHARRRSRSPADRRYDRNHSGSGQRQRSRSPADRHRRR